jgi:hypothetical protein
MPSAYSVVVALVLCVATACGQRIHATDDPDKKAMTCLLHVLKTMAVVGSPVLTDSGGPDGTRSVLKFETTDGANWTSQSQVEPGKEGVGHYYYRVRYVGPPHGPSVVSSIVNGLKKQCGVEVTLDVGID